MKLQSLYKIHPILNENRSAQESKQEGLSGVIGSWFGQSKEVLVGDSQDVKDFYQNLYIFNEFYFSKIMKEIASYWIKYIYL